MLSTHSLNGNNPIMALPSGLAVRAVRIDHIHSLASLALTPENLGNHC